MKCVRVVLLSMLFLTPHVLAQRSDLSGIKICIDPGHGGNNPDNDRRVEPDAGVVFWESESNFQKALLLRSLLEAKGGSVILTRNTNSYPNDDEPSLSARVALANANNVDWFHSIHSNAFNASANYTLLLVRESSVFAGQPESAAALSISQVISAKIQARLRTTNNYTRLDFTFLGYRLGVLNGLLMPGELSEGSFHDVPAETRRLMNNSYRKMEAYAIRDAFLQYFGVPADTLCIIAGILTSSQTGKPINGVQVRLKPENSIYTGDNYNNGFYMLDGIAAGPHTVRFETPGFGVDSVQVNVTAGTTNFFDRTLEPVAVMVEPTAGVLPSTFELRQNYPNPFNPATHFEFRLPAGQAGISNFEFVSLRVFDVLGREVAVLVNEQKAPATYRMVWDAGNLPSGVYLYRLDAGNFSHSRKMILAK